MATFDDTPTMTTVVTPRLRRIESTSVPAIGPSPCSRVEMMSESATEIRPAVRTISLPASSGPPRRAMARNSRALWFAPRMSARWIAT